MPQVGLRKFVYALLTSDTATGATYGPVKSIPKLVTAKITPKTSSGTLYADDGPADTDSTVGEIDVTIELADVPVENQAELLGHTLDGNGVLLRKTSDTSPYVAVGFVSQKTNGKDRYVWLFKGKAQVPDESYQTKNDKVNFGTSSLTFTFIRRDFDQQYQAIGDEDNSSFTAAATWFDSVYGSASDTTAPTVTTTPADAATGVADNSTVQWAFSEAIQASCVTNATFFVMKASDGTLVDGTLAFSSDAKTVTFTPAAALAAATAYIAVATTNVSDLAGNHLAANSTTNFTTV